MQGIRIALLLLLACASVVAAAPTPPPAFTHSRAEDWINSAPATRLVAGAKATGIFIALAGIVGVAGRLSVTSGVTGGVAGVAWGGKLLSGRFPGRVGTAGVAAQPPGDEDADPDRDDRQVQDRAAHPASPRRAR